MEKTRHYKKSWIKDNKKDLRHIKPVTAIFRLMVFPGLPKVRSIDWPRSSSVTMSYGYDDTNYPLLDSEIASSHDSINIHATNYFNGSLYIHFNDSII